MKSSKLKSRICGSFLRTPVLGLVLPLLLAGCDTWSSKMPMGDAHYQPVPQRHVLILFAPPQNRKFVELGIVSVIGSIFSGQANMYGKLQKAAADMGADAVVVIGEGTMQANWPTSTRTTGMVNTYGQTATADFTTTSTPSTETYPTNKGIAIKFIQ
jgi:hypothetical protein